MNGIFVENDLLSRELMIAVKGRVHTFSAFPDFTRGGRNQDDRSQGAVSFSNALRTRATTSFQSPGVR
jgi:hypothetical protein